MKLARPVFLAGTAITPFIGKGNPAFIMKGHPDFGRKENPSLEDHLVAAVQQLISAHLPDPSVVDRGYVGNFAGELFCNQGHLGAKLSRPDGSHIATRAASNYSYLV